MNHQEKEAFIEEENERKSLKICLGCMQPQIKTVLILGHRVTKNITRTCQNKKCFRYLDLEKTPSWVPV